MDNSITTASVVSLAEKLEDKSSEFYKYLSNQYSQKKELFLDFIKENERNKKQVVRTYQETISDALEASYAFKGIDLKTYNFDIGIKDGGSITEALEKAVKIEKTMSRFYFDIAQLSKSLLATIPRIFKQVAKRKEKRCVHLELLVKEFKEE
jgi:hypothetical protein